MEVYFAANAFGDVKEYGFSDGDSRIAKTSQEVLT
jgi:hypothetical protein